MSDKLAKQLPLAIVLVFAVFPRICVAQSRQVMHLDGDWQIAEGTDEAIPEKFDRTVPVPGLVDLAMPPFEEPGAVPDEPRNPHIQPDDIRRKAFWYRRTFSLADPIPAVALLKLHKAKFGARVYLNGAFVGEHLPNFTPAHFDVRRHLHGNGQENELIVRVGASPASVPPTIPWGFDFEKIRYFPGIYDSVDLILSGTPHVLNVQTVPDLPGQSVRAVVEVANAGEQTADVQLDCTVREWKSRRAAGQAATTTERINPGGEHRFDITIPLRDCHLWSPEDPFLYVLEVSTGEDRQVTRFGMRSFNSDPETGRMVLNGKPYYLRGSNVCIYRFFEDSARGAKPWDEAWVRKLHRRFKEMHWNCLRYCIGFPPEKWYEVADEEGLLIQDEYPIWFLSKWPDSLQTDQIATEYRAWMRERWNHASVGIWDAQNETSNDALIAAAIRKVRHLDLSNRPWDNGWGRPQAAGDLSESHPYRTSPYWLKDRPFRLSLFEGETGVPDNGPRKGAGPPYVINEYGWLWLNRDGSLPVLTRDLYNSRLGASATIEERRYFYARTLAAMTEFWRGRRKCAGVLHFCGLGYSRPDGYTSDNFIEIEKLTFEPNFFKYVRDAFAPVGVMIDLWQETLPANTGSLRVPLVVTSDLDRRWQGKITLRLIREQRTVWKTDRDITVEPWGTQTIPFEVNATKRPGKYQFTAELRAVDGEVVRSLRDFEVPR